MAQVCPELDARSFLQTTSRGMGQGSWRTISASLEFGSRKDRAFQSNLTTVGTRNLILLIQSTGSASPSLVSKGLESIEGLNDPEEIEKHISALNGAVSSMYIAGVDTV